jgi:hypothetical protein
MKTSCPGCGQSVEVEDSSHYDMVTCPQYEKEFQAFSDSTLDMSKEFLAELLKQDKDSGS